MAPFIQPRFPILSLSNVHPITSASLSFHHYNLQIPHLVKSKILFILYQCLCNRTLLKKIIMLPILTLNSCQTNLSVTLLQGIFPIQELNWGLPYCRQILYQLRYQGSPCYPAILLYSPTLLICSLL